MYGSSEDITLEQTTQSPIEEKVSSTGSGNDGSQGEAKKSSLADSSDPFISDIASKRDTFESRGSDKVIDFETGDIVNNFGSILTTIGVIAVLAGLLIIGIKYMVATPEQAAKLKTKLIGLAIAGIVVIAAYGIWIAVTKFIWNIAA